MSLSARQRLSFRQRAAGLLLYILPLPLLLKALLGLWQGDLGFVVGAGSAYALFLVAALLARRGLRNEAVFESRPFGAVSPPPLKTVSAALTGVATALAAFAVAGQPLPIAVLFGAGASLGFYLLYGLDPRQKRPIVGAEGVGGEELAAALREAYGRLESIDTAGQTIQSREFKERLSAIVGWVEKILKAIEEDPRDLRRARKFLNVYLDGTYKVTEQYARTHPRTQSLELENNFRALLIDMEKTCQEQYEALIKNDVFDLDVQIEVLNTRLKREGVI
jgi:hypothetical protein